MNVTNTTLGRAALAALATLATVGVYWAGLSTLDTQVPEATQSTQSTDAKIIDLVWDGLSTSERLDICEAYDMLGPSLSYDAFIESQSEPPSYAEFTEHFSEVCS